MHKTEVEELYDIAQPAAFTDEDVAGLDVAVDPAHRRWLALSFSPNAVSRRRIPGKRRKQSVFKPMMWSDRAPPEMQTVHKYVNDRLPWVETAV